MSDRTQKENRQRFGEAEITVTEAFTTRSQLNNPNGTIHLFQRCVSVGGRELVPLGSVTIKGSRICSECKGTRVSAAKRKAGRRKKEKISMEKSSCRVTDLKLDPAVFLSNAQIFRPLHR